MSDIKIYGSFTVAETPIEDNDIATKGYVDSLVSSSLKTIVTLTDSTIAPTEPGQIFYKSFTSATTFVFNANNIVFRENEFFEFYLILSKTAVSATLPSTWVWNGGNAPTTSSAGYYVFHIFTIDSGTTWLSELCGYSSTRQ